MRPLSDSPGYRGGRLLPLLVGVGEDDGTDLSQVGTASSLLGKLDLKALLSKKDKRKAAPEAQPAE